MRYSISWEVYQISDVLVDEVLYQICTIDDISIKNLHLLRVVYPNIFKYGEFLHLQWLPVLDRYQ